MQTMKSSPFIHWKITAILIASHKCHGNHILYMFLAQVYGDALDSHLPAVDL